MIPEFPNAQKNLASNNLVGEGSIKAKDDHFLGFEDIGFFFLKGSISNRQIIEGF